MRTSKLRFNNQIWTIILILIWIFLYNILNGLTLTFNDLSQESLKSKFSEVHFSSPGNDFGGGLFWLNTVSLSNSKDIYFNGGSDHKYCNKQLRWIYYNSARWARLWPLDQETLNLLTGSWWIGYTNLSLTGGLYTACSGNDNKYGIFGYIKYNRWWTLSYLIAWAKLNYATNSYNPFFANNFQYFNNITPLGYFWDSVWGIAFVGGNISWDQNLLDYLNTTTGNINDSFTTTTNQNITSSTNQWIFTPGTGNAQDTMRNILVQGNVILSKAIDIYERKAFMGNLEKRTILTNTDINSATVINQAKKNTEVLCRWKAYFIWTSPTTLPTTTNDNVLCYKNTNSLTIDLSDTAKYANKTIIVKNGNIVLTNTMNKTSPSLDIFIDQWNLYIESPSSAKINLDTQWYPESTNSTNSGVFLKGNFIVNGLLLWGYPGAETSIKSKLHLQGKIVILNTPTNSSQWRINQIENLFGTNLYDSRINLENVFTRECGLNGIANDGTICSGNTSTSTTPFVVLNSLYPSNVLK